MFTITTQINLPEERIKDLLCCALEGGSNYWYNIKKYINPNKVKVEFKHIDLPFIDGCGLVIEDIEEGGDEGIHFNILNKESMQKGLQIMADKYPEHFKNIIEDNEDAETGDVFLQCSVLGDIVFG